METNEQLKIIKRGSAEIISEDELRQRIDSAFKEKRPLRIKAGFDPTASDLHLGHTVLLRKLRQFQDLGHQVIFIIGDFTARIGDPSGRSQLRRPLTKQQVLDYAQTYKQQVAKILDIDRLEIVFNSSWFEQMRVEDFLKLTVHSTVSQMLARADFKKRFSQNEDISLLEFMYPLLQGYDSVMVRADLEIGGTDQIFNLLVGRQIQKDFNQPPQVVITMPLLEGLDGVQKMSKSYGNYIGITESAKDMFGKIMSIPDELMYKYYELLTDVDLNEVESIHPKEAKLRLAQEIVSQYHSLEVARNEREEFERVFSQGLIPEDMPTFKLSSHLDILNLLLESGLVPSKNEARRLLRQKAVFFEGRVVVNETERIEGPGIIKVGKRRFLKIIL